MENPSGNLKVRLKYSNIIVGVVTQKMLDAWKCWLKQLAKPKYVRLVINSSHIQVLVVEHTQ